MNHFPSSGSYQIRGRIYTPLSDGTHLSLEDGRIAVDQGRISSVGPWGDGPDSETGAPVHHLPSRYLISPGFIDTHLHAPQIEMIGSYGGHLLEWLERHTFPTEAKFSDPEYASEIARLLFPILLSHGTTTAMLFSSVHEAATHRFFRAAADSGIRAIIGKTMMDRNAPDSLLETPSESIARSRAVLEEWHGAAEGLIGYAITPRFGPTSTPDLLEAAGTLAREFPDCWIQTHISESLPELDLVRELFPDEIDYTHVYDRFGLLRKRTVLAHGIHLNDSELRTIATRGAGISHCPNSNLYLGSGLFPLDRIESAGIRIGLGTDVGAGTTPSMLAAMADTYKVQQVRGRSLDPARLWRFATLDGARLLDLDDVTGSLEPGKEADFIALDLEATDLLAMRTRNAESIEDLLAGCIFAGDDRTVAAAYVRGRRVHCATR
ncbi:MAG: guanine deaminase [Acidobacteria bacterium]|nr:guanine deaminase [Acidobacteriota bacterium]